MCRSRPQAEDRDISGGSGAGVEGRIGSPMTTYERRQFFDRLVQLRALYRLRGSDDSTVAISVHDVIAHAERRIDEADKAPIESDKAPTRRVA